MIVAGCLVVAGCGSSAHHITASSPPHSVTDIPPTAGPPARPPAPVSPSAAGFRANGAPAYGAQGPEGVPMETGPVLAPVNPAVNGQTVDGIGCNRAEQLAYHHHVHLAVFVNGQGRSVPLAVGIMPQVGLAQDSSGNLFARSSTHCFYWLHVHAQDGIVHIESPSVGTFTLGQVFDVWGQPLTATQVGAAQGPVTASINGQAYYGDPRAIPLNERDQIVLNVGGPTVSPPPIDWTKTQL